MIALYTLAEMGIMDRRMTGSALTGKGGEMEMKETENIPFDSMPQLIRGSFLTKEQVEKLKEPFKNIVSVVRCKDCRFVCFCDTKGMLPDIPVYAKCTITDDIHNPDWFCAYGERRDKDA